MGLRGIALGVAAATALGCVAGFAIDSNVKLKDENKQLVVQVENANTKYDEANALLEKARAEMTSLNLTLIEKQAVIDANAITIADLTSAKEQLQTQLNTVTTERDNLQTELDAEKEKYNNLVAEHTELTNTYNALVESNNLTLEQKAELETQLADKQTEIENKNAQINELTTAINAKDAEIATLTENYNNAVIQIEALQAENASLITERDNLQAQVTALQNEIESISKKVEDITITYYENYYWVRFITRSDLYSENSIVLNGRIDDYYYVGKSYYSSDLKKYFKVESFLNGTDNVELAIDSVGYKDVYTADGQNDWDRFEFEYLINNGSYEISTLNNLVVEYYVDGNIITDVSIFNSKTWYPYANFNFEYDDLGKVIKANIKIDFRSTMS